MKGAPVLLLLLAACSTAEGDPCNDASNTCDDAKTLRTCSGSVDAVGATRHWHLEPCTGSNPACVEQPATRDMSAHDRANRAMCAASPDPEPLCASHRPGTFCLGDHVALCKGGFLVMSADCQAGEVCFESSTAERGRALCGSQLETREDPGCAHDEVRTCHDNAVVSCACGFRTRRERDCPSPQVCVTAHSDTDSDAFCAASAQQDGRCAGHELALLCSGSDVVSCHSNYPVLRETCASGCDAATASCK